MRMVSCTLLLIALTSGPAKAATECIGTTVEMIGCYVDAQRTADEALNSGYQALIRLATRKDETVAEQLRVAQRAWRKFRDENCKLYDALDRARGGFLRAQCLLTITSDRAAEVEQLLDE